MKMPYLNGDLLVWATRFRLEHGCQPHVHELPQQFQIALGKKVFQYADYRDACRPEMSDHDIYKGCLRDHRIERDFPDGMDAPAQEQSIYEGQSASPD